MERICLVEDDPDIVQMLRAFLQQEGFSVCHAAGQQGALALLAQDAVDLLLVDISLADGNGFAVCSAAKDKNLPVVFLTASGDEYSVVAGLDMGADDYITKPFNILEVKARVKALLRRSAATKRQQEQDKRLTSGGLTIDPDARAAWKNDQPVELTAREFDLLELLMKHPNRVYSREQLLNQVWGYEYTGEYRTVDVHIRRLREKVEDDPASPTLLCTKWGVGYYFHGQ